MASVFVFDNVPFERRLAETIAWCAPRARASAPRTSLRSEKLFPDLLAHDRSSSVGSVVGHRAHIVGEVQVIEGRESLHGGRLLVCLPDHSLFDGAADEASRGYFDVNNVPPWDTWIALADDDPLVAVSSRQYVVAWVPPDLIECACAGIEANPEQSIAWLEDLDVGARAELQRLGLGQK